MADNDRMEASKDMCWLSVQFQGHKTDCVRRGRGMPCANRYMTTASSPARWLCSTNGTERRTLSRRSRSRKAVRKSSGGGVRALTAIRPARQAAPASTQAVHIARVAYPCRGKTTYPRCIRSLYASGMRRRTCLSPRAPSCPAATAMSGGAARKATCGAR